MDIPNTGAIFTLGKSHLAENTQSYFYIKNDPIKRLIAGPFQSAVICESGRLFVWGENHHGQLGIGGQGSSNTNNNNNSNTDIIIKPTCVKSLKTLGLKIADISFGSDWSIILTLSNELFFTGRNVFARNCTTSKNVAETTVNNKEICELIRKPFRLEEFDDCLSKSEEAENFISLLAGDEHFVVLTSFGRLIGWGSNQSHQLGSSKEDMFQKPYEIVLDSPIQHYTCGPESTLVLTENGKLYLTGRLNDFVFPDFTELQKNLSSNEQIIFMNISKASEIFIVTNAGSIYRSYESTRNKSLIFQRFYDYDSEENGPIWKLLKGTSFYAVLTRANKFYTTFSESGHHLKTFREISKFKNLRILDMALGDEHILVHGTPRLSSMAATIGSDGQLRPYMTQNLIMANTTTGGILNRISNFTNMALDETKTNSRNSRIKESVDVYPKTNSPVPFKEEKEEPPVLHEIEQKKDITFDASLDSNEFFLKEKIEKEISDADYNKSFKELEESIDSFESDDTVLNKKSPTRSLKTPKSSTGSVKEEIEDKTSNIKSLRPSTPFPENSPHGSPEAIMKKTPMRNFSYEAAISNNFGNHTSPSLAESLENIPDHVEKKTETAFLPGLTLSMPTPPTDEDEELRLEISESTDPLDHTVTVNEIRFINNGIDVTANVKKFKASGSEDSLNVTDEEDDDENEKDDEIDKKIQIRKQANYFIEDLEEEIDRKVKTAQAHKPGDHVFENKSKSNYGKVDSQLVTDSIEQAANDAGKGPSAKIIKTKETLGSVDIKAAEERESLQYITNKSKKSSEHPIEHVGNLVVSASDEVEQAGRQTNSNIGAATGDTINSALGKKSGEKKHVPNLVTSKISSEVQDAKNSISSMLKGKKNKVDIQKPIETLQQEDLQSESAANESGDGKSDNTPQSNSPISGVQDDERTTASANSNHTDSAGNPFEIRDLFDPELDAMVQRGKQALREELQAASVVAENKTGSIISETFEEKCTFYKFLEDIKEKSKGLSCRNEKSIKTVYDQPPRYSIEDEQAGQPVNSHANKSKVCAIL